jgi:hypothetical protein
MYVYTRRKFESRAWLLLFKTYTNLSGTMYEEKLSELEAFCRVLQSELAKSRTVGEYCKSEIELLRRKLSVVVGSFTSEREKYESVFLKVCT